MYWNVFKREVKTNKIVKLIKSIDCYGRSDHDTKMKAESIANRRNLLRHFYNKYYYTVEFDFE